MTFWNWGPTTIWRSKESVAFFLQNHSTLMHPKAESELYSVYPTKYLPLQNLRYPPIVINSRAFYPRKPEAVRKVTPVLLWAVLRNIVGLCAYRTLLH